MNIHTTSSGSSSASALATSCFTAPGGQTGIARFRRWSIRIPGYNGLGRDGALSLREAQRLLSIGLRRLQGQQQQQRQANALELAQAQAEIQIQWCHRHPSSPRSVRQEWAEEGEEDEAFASGLLLDRLDVMRTARFGGANTPSFGKEADEQRQQQAQAEQQQQQEPRVQQEEELDMQIDGVNVSTSDFVHWFEQQ
ncbi:hypothetical protein GGI42DRAFT_352257 [Trichoderma sp. SZMC 28013]